MESGVGNNFLSGPLGLRGFWRPHSHSLILHSSQPYQEWNLTCTPSASLPRLSRYTPNSARRTSVIYSVFFSAPIKTIWRCWEKRGPEQSRSLLSILSSYLLCHDERRRNKMTGVVEKTNSGHLCIQGERGLCSWWYRSGEVPSSLTVLSLTHDSCTILGEPLGGNNRSVGVVIIITVHGWGNTSLETWVR